MPRKKAASDKSPKKELPKPGTPERRKAVGEAFETLSKRANKGDEAAKQTLVRFLKSNEWLLTKFGDAAALAEEKIIEVMAGGDWVGTQCMVYEASKLRKLVAGSSPTALEEVAAQRISTSWLLLQHVQVKCLEQPRDPAWGKFWLRRLEVAERMFDQAVKSFVIVKQLLSGNAHAPVERPSLASPAAGMVGAHTNGQAGSKAPASVNRVSGFFNGQAMGHDGSSTDSEPNMVNGVNGTRTRPARKGAGVH